MGSNFKVRIIYKYIENQIPKYFVYIGDSDVSNEIYGGEIGLIDKGRPYMKLPSCNMVLFLDELKVIKANLVTGPLFISKKIIDVPPYEFNSLINSICNILLDNYTMNVVSKSNQNFDPNNNILKDVVFPEKLIRLLMWNDQKQKIKFEQKKLLEHVNRFNLYFAYLGTNIGCEIDKFRPVLVWKQHECSENPSESSYYVFPVSSKIPKKNYACNVEIEVNGKKNIVKVNDGKRISIKRIVKPLIDNSTNKTYILEQSKIDEIKNAIKTYFMLN